MLDSPLGAAKVGMTDALDSRPGLPRTFRYLEATYPRSGWSAADLHPIAQHWLEIHGWFRGQIADLGGLGTLWREGQIGAGDYRGAVMPRMRQLLNHLHHHHDLESTHAFPQLIAAEPRMTEGLALLDRDHDAIEHLLSAMAEAAAALNQAPGEPAALANVLAERIERGTALIERHLWDEEEIVVPVLNLRGDQIRL